CIPQHFGLVDTSWDAVQDQGVLLRMEPAGLSATLDEVVPKLDRRSVGHQFTAAGVFDEDTPHFAIRFETAKDFTTSTVKQAGNSSQNLSLGAFSRAWCTE